MLLPTNQTAAFLLLLISFVCLGSWPNLFKAARWRYELFYFDFTAGALLVSLIAACTFGTFGSELSYVDRIAVAGLKSQALAMGAGFSFGTGAMLLLAAMSLLGTSLAFPLAFSLAFLVVAAANWRGVNWISGAGSVLCLAVAAIFLANSARRPEPGHPPAHRQGARANAAKAFRGIFAAILGGVLMGVSYPLGAAAFWGDLGLGAYAGALMFAVGIALSTLIFNIFLMNIGLDGGRVTLPAYLKGKRSQHLLGLAAGAVWAAGMLAALLAQSFPFTPGVAAAWMLQGWVLLAVAWATVVWKEFAAIPFARRIGFLIGCLIFAIGVSLSGLH